MALACALPNFVVLVPADEHETRAATQAMAQHLGPVYMWTSRPKFPLTIGVANLLRSGDDVTLIANGLMVSRTLQAAETLTQEGIEARVVLDMHTVKPIDREAVVAAAQETGGIVTTKEHLTAGGTGTQVARVVAENHPVPAKMVAIEDTYAQSGKPKELLEEYGLTVEHIAAAAKEAMTLKY